mmetsp:Transcript_12736/g.36558  ORF Transcript_12736/g.36558 Transcript_12736/m.36558 type:complete len:200 (-) Transcript_12736:494-1093(-)
MKDISSFFASAHGPRGWLMTLPCCSFATTRNSFAQAKAAAMRPSESCSTVIGVANASNSASFKAFMGAPASFNFVIASSIAWNFALQSASASSTASLSFRSRCARFSASSFLAKVALARETFCLKALILLTSPANCWVILRSSALASLRGPAAAAGNSEVLPRIVFNNSFPAFSDALMEFSACAMHLLNGESTWRNFVP